MRHLSVAVLLLLAAACAVNCASTSSTPKTKTTTKTTLTTTKSPVVKRATTEASDDTEDEVHARQSVYCPSNKFRCTNGQCISRDLVCDGRRDCRDGSDEYDTICDYQESPNPPSSSGIPSGYEVYPFENQDPNKRPTGNQQQQQPQQQQQQPQRPSTSSNVNTGCGSRQFSCNNGRCISDSRTCDGYDDCGDGSDETSRLCSRNTPAPVPQRPSQNYPSQRPPVQTVTTTQKPVPFSCRAGEFYCLSNQCIDNGLVCDGHRDCADGSDEAESICPASVKPPPTARPPINQGGAGGNQGSWNSPSLTPCRVPAQPRNGRWRVHRSLCATGIECELPSNVRSLDPGSYLVYYCDKGYSLNGTQDVLCGPGGLWVHEPKCDEVKCHDLSTSSREAICVWNNLAVSCEIPVKIGTTAQLACREGFVQEVSYSQSYKNLTCLENGQWDKQEIQCVRKPKKVKLVLEGDMIIND